MKHLLIVYHTQSGNTGMLADSVYAGACTEAEVETRLVRAFDGTLEDLLWCDAVLFGTPENFGYMSGALKDFYDRSYYPFQEHPSQPGEKLIPYGLFISAGNDGSGAIRECDRILLGYPMKKVLEPFIAKGEVTERHKQQAFEMGQQMACGLAFGIY